jgi:hypothetical protein
MHKPLIAILLCLSALPVQPTVTARWLTSTTAEVAWSGPGGAGVCLVKAGPPALVLTESCGEPSGVVVLAPGGDYLRAPREGDRLALWDGTRVLASATLGPAPRWEQRLVLVVAP